MYFTLRFDECSSKFSVPLDNKQTGHLFQYFSSFSTVSFGLFAWIVVRGKDFEDFFSSFSRSFKLSNSFSFYDAYGGIWTPDQTNMSRLLYHWATQACFKWIHLHHLEFLHFACIIPFYHNCKTLFSYKIYQLLLFQ